MASKLPDLEEQDDDEDEEAAESKETDINTLRSDSTYGSETPEACGGGHPTPEDESTTRSYSLRSQEFDTQHLVNCTFSVSLALPVVAPNDIEPRKLDLVLFGPLAKLYLEAESKSETPKDSERPKSKKSSTLHISVVKPWIENDQVWVSWNHSIEINVTSDFLMKLRDHNIKLRLWDLKEKVCAKARFSKQKSNPPSSDQAAFDGSVKRMVLFQRNFLERNQPKPSYTKTKPSEVPGIPEKSATGTTAVAPSSAVSKHLEEDPDSAIEQKTYCKSSSPQRGPKSEELSQSLSAISISGSIPSSLREKTIQEAKIIKQKLHKKVSAKSTVAVFGKTNLGKLMEHSDRKDSVGGVLLQLSERKKLLQKSVFLGKKSGATLKPTAKEIAALTAQAKKFGIAFLQLDLMPLLSGERYVASRLREKSPKIYDAYLSFSVEKPLMTEKQKRELNPLIIKIKSARCLPDTPIPIEELQSSCVPVYCKYKFQNMQPRQTQGRDHGTDVFFEDINVILAGTIKHGELNEYLRGPPLEIEVHDRDKKMEGVKIKPSLFGEEPGDHKLSNVSMVTSRYMVQNPITSREEMWHPYGVAKISLAELLLGEKVLNFSAPIHSCSVQDTSVCQGASTAQKAKGVSQCQVVQMPMGHYVCSESYLKVRVEITIPLSPEDETDDTETDYCPYGCIIYIFDYKNTSLISYLLQEITKINAEALQLDSYPLHIIQNSLNTLKLNHKLTFEEISQMDVLTGFHILDGSIHLLILEGLKNKALKRIWNKRIDRLHETKTGRLQIFYNSHLSFHQRLYVDFEAILFHIRLCKPLSSIMKQPLFYVRDIVPQPCFEALTRLDYICRSMKLREVIHHSLLPSAEMVTMLSQEFGVPLNKDDLLIQQYSEISEMFEMPTKYLHMKQDKRSLLDNHNEEYILRKKEMERHTPQDYIQSNIDNITLLSKMVKKEGTRTIRAFPSDGKSIFNYSCQTLNSAEIAKKLLRQEMAEEPDKRFAYNQEYLSGIFDPVVEDSALKESIDQSKSMWLSPEGFVYPGFKSSIESNLHPHMPDEARLMELHEKWQENLLNASNMKPVLDRDRWSWDKRNVDFELYKKPPCAFVPLDTHRVEPLTDTRCNTALKVHRCCPATELISSGPKASSQLARLQGLLKDKPIKLSFKMQPTPILGTLDNVEESSICQGFVPGSETHHSLKWNGNIIPCYDRKHNVFKTLKGADFRLICHKHSFRYKRWPPQRLRLMDKILTKDRQDGVTFAPELNN